MKHKTVRALLLLFPAFLFATNFSGHYKMSSGGIVLSLVLHQSGQRLNGELSGTTGTDFKLQGQVQGEFANGKCSGSGMEVYFNLYFEETELYLQLVELDNSGEPDWTKIKELVFAKSNNSSSLQSAPYTAGTNEKTQSNPLSRKTEGTYSGRFSGDGLTLDLQQSGSSVQGRMQFENYLFDLKGSVSGQLLTGSFSSMGSSFNYSATKTGANMEFKTDGTIYHLKSLTPVCQNPPAQKTKPPSRNRSTAGKHTGNSNHRIKVDSMGLSFVTPENWIAKNDPNSGNVTMVSNTIPGMILILPHSYQSLQELVNNSTQGFSDGNTQLYPSGQTESISNHCAGAEFSGIFQGVQAKAYVVGVVSPQGGGFLGICVTTPEKYSHKHKTSVVQLAQSTEFYTPRADTALMQALAGKYYSYVGNTERQFALCPNGVFYDSRESAYSGGNEGNWGAASTNSGSGKWRAVGNRQAGTIIFSYTDGTQVEKQYQAGRDAFYLDGVKYGYNGQADCR
jgi:hypothetical protein